METPFVMNDKEFIGASYLHTVSKNEIVFVVSTKGNDAMYDKYSSNLNKKRDRGTVNVIYFNVKEDVNTGFVSVTHVIDMVPGGKIISGMKGKLADQHAALIKSTVEWVQKNCWKT